MPEADGVALQYVRPLLSFHIFARLDSLRLLLFARLAQLLGVIHFLLCHSLTSLPPYNSLPVDPPSPSSAR